MPAGVVLCSAAASVTRADESRPPLTPSSAPHTWVRASAVSPAAAEASATSVFVLLYHVPAAPAARFGDAAAVRAGAAAAHFSAKRARGARALLTSHCRGALEVPGGHRDALPGGGAGGPLEPCAAAAARELWEEAGVALSPPLSFAADAAAVRVEPDGRGGGRARWVLFARRLSAEDFDAAVRAGPAAPMYLAETYGNVAAHAIVTRVGGGGAGAGAGGAGTAASARAPIEGGAASAPSGAAAEAGPGGGARAPARAYGLPRTLALMAAWQGDMLLAGLQAAGALSARDAADAVELAAAWRDAGGPWAAGGPRGLLFDDAEAALEAAAAAAGTQPAGAKLEPAVAVAAGGG